jgi:hypothetical protein
MSLLGRYLVDYENPDAGIGHSLGHVNNAIKICLRHDLTFAYAESQVRKSSKTQWRWRFRQWIRRLTFRQTYETHDIGNDINALFAFRQYTEDRDRVERLIRQKKLKVVLLPETTIHIPSNAQQDDVAYLAVDTVIRSHPEDGVVFRLPEKRTGDFEYQVSRDWFRRCYFAVPENQFPPEYATRIPSNALKIAVHIRRGDLLPGRQFDDLSKRMLPDAWYLRIVECIIRAASEQPLVIYIVSEGLDGQYCSEQGLPVVWQEILSRHRCSVVELIDRPFVESFRVLVGADILVGSKSGMTHLAGMLGEQTKFVPRMWHSYRGASRVLELGDEVSDGELAEIASLTMAQCLRSVNTV